MLLVVKPPSNNRLPPLLVGIQLETGLPAGMTNPPTGLRTPPKVLKQPSCRPHCMVSNRLKHRHRELQRHPGEPEQMQHSQPGSNVPPRRIKGQFVRSQLRICDSSAHEKICSGEVVVAGRRDSAAQSLSHEAVECGPGMGTFELGKDSF